MPQNNIPSRQTKNTDNPMSKNLFVFKYTPSSANLENDPSVMKYQFQLKMDKNRELGHPEPIHKAPKRRTAQPKAVLSTTRQATYVNHADSPATSERTPSLYNNASSPVFFPASQSMNFTASTYPANLNASTSTNPSTMPSSEKKKIQISTLLNQQMVNEKTLDAATIQTLAEAFRAPEEQLETGLSTLRIR
jgi:hypothetical protein